MVLSQGKIKENVEYLLKEYKPLRDSDLLLFVYYANKFLGAGINANQIEKLKQTPSYVNIARVRREIQKSGKYEASKEIKEGREKKFMDFKHHYSPHGSDKDIL